VVRGSMMQPYQDQHNTNDTYNRDDLANERCMTFGPTVEGPIYRTFAVATRNLTNCG